MKTKKIVTIGGGTGSFTLLSGLKEYPVELSAVVSMADDGGSTGKLREELDVLPPGDARQCLLALSETSRAMKELMNYRFTEGSLRGHNFGNLFVSALEKSSGSFSRGIEELSKILHTQGEVLPVSEGNMQLVTELENGKRLYGENELDKNEELRKKGVVLKKITLKHRVQANKKVLEKVKKADVIILGPGDQFGSITPNLLIPEVSAAIKKSKAKVLYICALTNKRGLTPGWTVHDYVKSLEKYIGKNRIDYVLYNVKKISPELIRRYERQEGKGAVVALGDIKSVTRTYKIVKVKTVSAQRVKRNKNDLIADTRSFIRDDSKKLAQAIMLLLDLESGGKVIKDIV